MNDLIFANTVMTVCNYRHNCIFFTRILSNKKQCFMLLDANIVMKHYTCNTQSTLAYSPFFVQIKPDFGKSSSFYVVYLKVYHQSWIDGIRSLIDIIHYQVGKALLIYFHKEMWFSPLRDFARLMLTDVSRTSPVMVSSGFESMYTFVHKSSARNCTCHFSGGND